MRKYLRYEIILESILKIFYLGLFKIKKEKYYKYKGKYMMIDN